MTDWCVYSISLFTTLLAVKSSKLRARGEVALLPHGEAAPSPCHVPSASRGTRTTRSRSANTG